MIKNVLAYGLIAFSAIAEAGYFDNNDGTVTDRVTGLTWMRCAHGQVWDGSKGACSGTALAVDWTTAMAAPQGFANQADWRLPNIRELYALVAYDQSGPALDKSVLGVADNSAFWSSTVTPDSNLFALTLRFWWGGFDKYSNGILDKQSRGAFARYVRGQETSRLLAAARPANLYQIGANGTINDNVTGLVWQPCLVGQAWTGASCSGTAKSFLFDATSAAAAADRFAGYDDWRVPTLVELLTLIDATRAKPALNTAVFKSAVTGDLWSSTVNAGNATYGWYLDLDHGEAHTITTSVYAYALRLVRGVGAYGPYAGTAVVAQNPYGPVNVIGATHVGSVISNFTEDTEIQFGNTNDGSSDYAEIDFNGLSLGPNRSLKISVGVSDGAIVLRNMDNTMTEIGGVISAIGRNGGAPPALFLKNAHGVQVDAPMPSVNEVPSLVAVGGLTIDTLAASPYVGGAIVNWGAVDGGIALDLLAAQIHGGGDFFGDSITVRTSGNANNPVNGSHFLDNSLHLLPSSSSILNLTLNDYGLSPQFLNLKVDGSAFVSMPSRWSSGTALANNAPVPPGSVRPAGTPAPAYGGGSIILQATKDLTLVGGASNDFVFPGGIALKAGGVLNLAGVTVNQGWTTAGKQFQGIYFEAATITSPVVTSIYSNALNWTNFSVMPAGHFRIWNLTAGKSGEAQYEAGDGVAAHLNTYSFLIDLAANGLPWLDHVNRTPIVVY